jgi:hypothetical protein
VSGIVDHHIEPSALRDDLLDRGVRRFLRCDIELDGAEVHLSLSCVFFDGFHRSGIAAPGIAHAGIDGVSGIGQRSRREGAEAARRAGDDDHLFHRGIHCGLHTSPQ